MPKYVYLFKEGNKDMKDLLGGKGANLAEMTSLNMPVPSGFTITSKACLNFYEEKENLNEEIIKEIFENLKNQLDEPNLSELKSKTVHLGVFTEPYLSYMMAGRKTIESRFSKNKIAPYEKLTKEDVVFIKKSGGGIVGYFTIEKVLFFDLLKTPIDDIKDKYASRLCVDEAFWTSKKDSNYATLIMIDKVYPLTSFRIHKKGMQTWIRL